MIMLPSVPITKLHSNRDEFRVSARFAWIILAGVVFQCVVMMENTTQ